MPEITKKIASLVKKVDKLIDDAAAVVAAGKAIKDSLPKKAEKPDDKQEA